MLEKQLKLFGLNSSFTLADVKKAYRLLAKKNHPDRFADEEQKNSQQLVMAQINEAYTQILAEFRNIKKGTTSSITGKVQKPAEETDYQLYKKGIDYFKQCYAGIFVKMEQYDLKIKEENLTQAKDCFSRLLQINPESDWAFDAEEKLKKIEKILASLKLNGSKTEQTLPKKDQNFYSAKFKEMFRK